MSSGTSSSLVEALKEADAENNRKGVIRVSPSTIKDETRTIINGACTIRPIIQAYIVQNRCNSVTIVEEGPSQGNTKPSPRRPLRGNATGLLMPVGVTNQLTQSGVPRFGSPTIIRVGNRLPSTVLSTDGRNRILESNVIPVKFVPAPLIFVPNKPSVDRMEIEDETKQNVCTGCRALTNKTVCSHCGTQVDSDLKRLKTETVISPLVTITKLHPAGVNTPAKKTAPKRYQPLEIVRVNGKCNQPPLKRMAVRQTIREPPECLTLSSDDETEKSSASKSDCNRPSEIAGSDEKLSEMTNSSVPTTKETESMTTEVNLTDFDPVVPAKHSIVCRSVRIGSYKCKSVVVRMTDECFNLEIPCVTGKGSVKINLTFRDMSQILVHFGSNLPFLAIKTTQSYSSAIRNRLQMSPINGPYYNPDSSDELQKRIILLPDKLPEEARVSIKKWFKEREIIYHNTPHRIFEEIPYKVANEILLKSVPPEIKDQVFGLNKNTKVQILTKVTSPSLLIKSKELKSETPSKIMAIYPVPPLAGGISITTGDLKCLNPETCLNDAIIDFYLKYLYYEKLSEYDRQRTHVFSSFFYGKLVSSRSSSKSRFSLNRSSLSHEDHINRLKGWTKHVDIFSKDFIIIPINQKNHWFLAIICFPILAGEANLTLAANDKSSEDKSPEVESSEVKSPELESSVVKYSEVKTPEFARINEVAVIKEAPLSLVNYDDDSNSSTETVKLRPEDFDPLPPDIEMKDPDDPNLENVENVPSSDLNKIPCILLFDSLHSRNWSGVAANLREYLNMEWKAKRNTPRTFDKDNIKGAYPIVPQQSNYMDCGIYLLQNVESFFQNPIKDFRVPIRGLQNWFTEDVIIQKRKDIQEIILRLSREQSQNGTSETKCDGANEGGSSVNSINSVRSDSGLKLSEETTTSTSASEQDIPSSPVI